MTKIAITADLHFGVPGRTDDILWSCRVIREHCRSAGIDTIVVLGDLYHNRQSIEIDVNSKVCNFFEQTKEEYDQQWVVFPGNHDMFLRHSWQINSLSPLRKHLSVIEQISILDINGARFWVVPFITYERTYMKVIRSIIKHEQFRPHQDCLFTHIGVRSATLNTCFLIKDWSTVTFDDTPFKRIYTGHFHSQQQVGDNLWYPGSPIPFKFDEGDVPHGFYVYDTQRDDHHFVDIWQAGEKFFPDEPAPPQFITILDDSIPEQTSQQVKNCIVRVALQREYTNHEKSQIKQKILALDAANVRWMDVCKRDEQPRSSQPTVVHNDLFASWISQDTDNIHDLDVKILSRCNQEVVHQADELYSIESSEE